MTPIPHDIPLPLPAPAMLLKLLLVVAFLAHILFVNLMVGGTILTLIYELRGLKKRIYDDIAISLARTITVNKSIAVVLGVAPLLLINVLYTVWFYSSNALTGTAWIMIVPSVTLAFLLTYLHQYSWNFLSEHKGIHLSIIAASVALFLAIPFIFLVNVNLMLFPDRWSEVKGFFSALLLPNVLPRYLHFIAASLAITALFLVGWIKRTRGDELTVKDGVTTASLQREFYSIALVVSVAQFIIGPLVFFTLPSQGISLLLILSIGAGATLAVPAILLMWREIRDPQGFSRRRYAGIIVLLSGTVIFMASGRHLYRETALKPYQEAMAIKTREYMDLVAQAQKEAASLPATTDRSSASRGEEVFEICSACHGVTKKIIGPPLTEIAKIYEGNPEGIVKWAKAPGKKRPNFPQMPAMPLPDEDLLAVGKYMIETGGKSSP